MHEGMATQAPSESLGAPALTLQRRRRTTTRKRRRRGWDGRKLRNLTTPTERRGTQISKNDATRIPNISLKHPAQILKTLRSGENERLISHAGSADQHCLLVLSLLSLRVLICISVFLFLVCRCSFFRAKDLKM